MNISFDVNKGLENKRTRRFTMLIVVTFFGLVIVSMFAKGCHEQKCGCPAIHDGSAIKTETEQPRKLWVDWVGGYEKAMKIMDLSC